MMRSKILLLHFAALCLCPLGAYAQARDKPIAAVSDAQLRSGNDPISLTQRADDLFIAGKYPAAEALYREALAAEIVRSGNAGAATAARYMSIGSVLEVQVKYPAAETAYRQALGIYERTGAGRGLQAAQASGAVASLLRAQGRDREALPFFRSALDIHRRPGAIIDRNAAFAYLQLADGLNRMGRTEEAEPLVRKALEIWQAINGEVHPATVSAYRSLAANLAAQGRYEQAEPILRKALELGRASFGETNSGTAAIYNDLAALLEQENRFADAEPLFRKALDIRNATLGDRYPATARSYNSLAGNLIAQGRFGEAEPLLGRAVTIWGALFKAGHPDLAAAYGNQAASLEGQGKLPQAEALYRKALDIQKTSLGMERLETAQAYSALAGNLAAQAHYASAEAAAAQGVAIARRIGTYNQALHARTSAANRHDNAAEQIITRYIDISWTLASRTPSRLARSTDNSFFGAQEILASGAASAMAQAAARVASNDPGLAVLVRQSQDLGARLDRIDKDLVTALGSENSSDAVRLRQEYETTASQVSALATRIDGSFPRYRELASSSPIPISKVQALLGPDEGLVLIIPTGRTVQTFAVTRITSSWGRSGASTERIQNQIAALRCEVDVQTCSAEQTALNVDRPRTPFENRYFKRFDLDLAYQLYRSLIAPVEPSLRGVRRLYVVTAGALGDLPLGLLVTAPPAADADLADPDVLLKADWLTDRFAMTTLPAVSALRLQNPQGPVAKPGSAFRGYGDPALTGWSGPKPEMSNPGSFDEYGARAGNRDALLSLAALPGTRVELTAMARLFGNATDSLVLGPADTETAVRNDPKLASARILAFATHGLLPSGHGSGQEPGLVFTLPAAPSASDDGILTASEVAELTLSADLVVLSACSSASTESDAGGGDSLSALARGFLYAGARALLATHWRVSDDATAVLTVETLAARQRPGVTRAQALQIAMRIVRTGKRPDGSALETWNPAWAHPSIWAPFSHIANHDD